MGSMTGTVLGATLLCSALRIASGTFERIRDSSDDFECPFKEETLLYNIDIFVEGIGDGCGDYDLYNIGDLLQGVVDEVEEEIPEYKRREKMETVICPNPLKEDIRRNLLRSRVNDDASRSLEGTKPKIRRKRKRYRYRGSGKCRRCKANNSDRRLQDSLVDDACASADTAAFAASVAVAGTKSATAVLADLRKYVLKFCDYTSSGQETILKAKKWIQEARGSQKRAQQEAKRAKSQCQQARRATSDMERVQFARSAGTAANDAVNAAENVKSRYSLLNDAADTNICFQDDDIRDDGSITIDSVCVNADLAEFGADMATTAAISGGEAYAQLKEVAVECNDLGFSQDVVFGAKGTLSKIKLNQKAARNASKKARTQCQLAAQATSGTQLMEYMRQAEELVQNVFDATERAEGGSRNLSDIVAQRDVCYTKGPPTTAVSVEAVCQRSAAATVAADLATTIYQNANAAFSDVRERVLSCETLGSGRGWVTRAKEFLSQCKDAQKLARKESRKAKVQCRKARNAVSDTELRGYMLATGSASQAARTALQNAKSRYLILRNERERDVCSQGFQVVSSNINADSVCKHADIATFGADMATAAKAKGNTALLAIREEAIVCDNLQSGQEVTTKASELFKGINQSRTQAANGARKARQECQKAKRATTNGQMEQSLSKAQKLVEDSLVAAERAQTGYLKIKEIPVSTICDADGADIEVSYETKDPVYTGGTYGEKETSLRLWLVRLANMLYAKIPPELIATYGNSATPNGCELEGFKIEIEIDAFEQLGEASYWIGNRRDCIRIST